MRQIDMAIDKTIYNNGIKGLLSHYEIDSLSSDYEMHKGNFHEMTEKVSGKKHIPVKNNVFLLFIKNVISWIKGIFGK